MERARQGQSGESMLLNVQKTNDKINGRSAEGLRLKTEMCFDIIYDQALSYKTLTMFCV